MKKQLFLLPLFLVAVTLSGCRLKNASNNQNSQSLFELAGKYYSGQSVQEQDIENYQDLQGMVNCSKVFFYHSGKMVWNVYSETLTNGSNRPALTFTYTYTQNGNSLSYVQESTTFMDALTVSAEEKTNYSGEITLTGLVLEYSNSDDKIVHVNFKLEGTFNEDEN